MKLLVSDSSCNGFIIKIEENYTENKKPSATPKLYL